VDCGPDPSSPFSDATPLSVLVPMGLLRGAGKARHGMAWAWRRGSKFKLTERKHASNQKYFPISLLRGNMAWATHGKLQLRPSTVGGCFIKTSAKFAQFHAVVPCIGLCFQRFKTIRLPCTIPSVWVNLHLQLCILRTLQSGRSCVVVDALLAFPTLSNLFRINHEAAGHSRANQEDHPADVELCTYGRRL
jgi:hypothetical protein